MRSDHVGGLREKVKIGKYGYAPKGIFFAYEYAEIDFKKFKSNFLKRLPISNVTLTARKSRNPRDTPIQLTFKNEELPDLIKIAGEQALTKVYEQKRLPMLCKMREERENTAKYCREQITCRKRDEQGHTIGQCKNSIVNASLPRRPLNWPLRLSGVQVKERYITSK